MARVSIATLDNAPVEPAFEGSTGRIETRGLVYRDTDPLHLHIHHLARDAVLHLGSKPADCVVYVWSGTVVAGGRTLAAGSSLIVEHGATIDVQGHDVGSQVLTFAAVRPSAQPRAGGHVHLLPQDRVPRTTLPGTRDVGGAMHADAACPTCQVWLHENSMGPTDHVPTAEEAERAIHSHSEDEIIFVTDGEIRLGARLYGPGTALAVAAHTLYSFSVGPKGLTFINFRAGCPSDIKFKDGRSMDEVAFWRDRVARPDYLAPVTMS